MSHHGLTWETQMKSPEFGKIKLWLELCLLCPLLPFGIIGAFSAPQKRAILERDEHKCQSPIPHNCNPDKGLEIDHILPQRYLYNLDVDPDFPENALTKCKNAHDIKHPDRVPARRTYHQAKEKGVDSFKALEEQRIQKLKMRQIYWNDKNDRQDQVVAIRNTQRAKKKGWVFPDKETKNAQP